ncbi:MAG: hypothetical protein KKA19_03040 [Candidatus Margulisbacteria bacterium]|nr:hypothetical protein [Candidatus Margulisiibacteriota bacterium]
MKKGFTIKEISEVTGKSKATIYRYVKDEKLPTFSSFINGQEILKATSKDIERVFGIKLNGEKTGNNGNEKANEKLRETTFSHEKANEKPLSQIIQENVDIAIQKALSQRETLLLKPLEEQAMYISGKLQAENRFLKERLETVLHELGAYKALPGPVEEIKQKIEEQAQLIIALEEEKEEILNKQKENEQEKTQALHTAQEKETTIKILQEEKEAVLSEKKQIIEKLQMEKEKELQEFQEEIAKKEQEEKDLLATVNALKERLEAEEQKSWWQKLWG